MTDKDDGVVDKQIKDELEPNFSAKQAANKFALYRQDTAQLLANRLKAKGHLYKADMATLIRENIADPWPQELADYVADRFEGLVKGPQGREKNSTALKTAFESICFIGKCFLSCGGSPVRWMRKKGRVSLR